MEPTGVDVRWHLGRTADEALVDHVRVVAATDSSAAVAVGRLCPQCGSAGPGRPWVEVRDGHAARRLEVSLARSGPHVVTAVAEQAVGVDVEGVEDVARGWDPALVLAPGERADSSRERARAWTRKEAVLKARGTGLATPMSMLVLAEVDWTDLPAPPGHVAALSTGAAAARISRAGRAAPYVAAMRRTARRGPRR
jgi:4'-phosphopantetheinyl transferase